MHQYAIYGLGVHSTLPLPELGAPAEAFPDLIIRTGDLSRLSNGDGQDCVRQTEDGHYLYWATVGSFLVRSGREIIVDILPDVDPSMVRLPLLGTVLATALHQRGLLILHGSAVTIGNEAIVFAGNSGQGKSTMTAALHERGHRLITDDIVVVRMVSGMPIHIWPSYSRIKLWPDSLRALGLDPQNYPRLNTQVEKCDYHAEHGFSQEDIRLRAIYILERGELGIKPIASRIALLEVLRNTYLSRFGRSALGDTEARQLQQCTQIVQNVPLYTLSRPTDLTLLPTVAALVEKHHGLDI